MVVDIGIWQKPENFILVVGLILSVMGILDYFVGVSID